MRDTYNAYINSPAWKKLRDEMIEATYISDAEAARDSLDLERGRYRCQHLECRWNFEKKDLEVHHRHYDTLGCEKPWDLAVVCKDCHIKLDRVRAKEGQRRSRESYDEAWFQNWAEREYGEGWAMYHEVSEVWEAFLEYLRDRGEGY
jgi:5-methylcytosine-specific restriction endonuclease McrA